MPFDFSAKTPPQKVHEPAKNTQLSDKKFITKRWKAPIPQQYKTNPRSETVLEHGKKDSHIPPTSFLSSDSKEFLTFS